MAQRIPDQGTLELARQIVADRILSGRQPARDFLLQRLDPVGDDRTGAFGARLTKVGRQVGDLNGLRRRHHGQPMTDVFQLPYIARPVEGAQILECGVGQPLDFDPKLACALAHEMSGQQGNVLAPVAHRRQA